VNETRQEIQINPSSSTTTITEPHDSDVNDTIMEIVSKLGRMPTKVRERIWAFFLTITNGLLNNEILAEDLSPSIHRLTKPSSTSTHPITTTDSFHSSMIGTTSSTIRIDTDPTRRRTTSIATNVDRIPPSPRSSSTKPKRPLTINDMNYYSDDDEPPRKKRQPPPQKRVSNILGRIENMLKPFEQYTKQYLVPHIEGEPYEE
ncbi:unnamed protein product, partial [Didymodactylos carnosus]